VQVAGIIAGQITLGFLADRIGRKWGSVTTASLMLIGGILILASAGNSPHGIFLMYTTCQVCIHSQPRNHPINDILPGCVPQLCIPAINQSCHVTINMQQSQDTAVCNSVLHQWHER